MKKFDSKIQIKIGKKMLEEVVKYARSQGIPKNRYIRECIEKYNPGKRHVHRDLSLAEIFSERTLILFGTTSDVVKKCNEESKKLKVNRTVYILDAILAGLRRTYDVRAKELVRLRELGMDDPPEY